MSHVSKMSDHLAHALAKAHPQKPAYPLTFTSSLKKIWSVLSLSNGLDDFKMALYICPNHKDIGIHLYNSHLDTLEQGMKLLIGGIGVFIF